MSSSEQNDPISSVAKSIGQSAMGAGLPVQQATAAPTAAESNLTSSHPLELSESTQVGDVHKTSSGDETTSESGKSAEGAAPSSSNKNKQSSNNSTNSNEKIHNESLSRSVTMSSSGSSQSQKPNKASLIDLFRFASKWDLVFNAAGLLAAIAAGAAQPLMTIVFGNLTTSFLKFTNTLMQDPAASGAAADDLRSNINKDALYLLYIGIAMFGATYIYMATWVYTGEEITRRIRVAYLTSVLRQDIAYFDELGPGEVTTRIQSDIQLIQEGISDKIPMSVMFVSTFVTGFIVAYVRSWKLALALSSIIPLVMISGAVMNILMSKAQQIELEHISHGATVAEEAIATVRTAKAFGIEQRLVDLYDESNTEATKLGIRKAIINGIGMGAFFFVIYSGYALAFYFGSKLIASGEIASGIVMNVIFSIFIGAFSMAMLAPNMQSLAYALGAGGKIFETIDRIPPIDSSSEEGARPEECTGEIELKNVDFTYPARPEVQILEDFSVKIPAGKVSALVGSSGSGKSTIVGLVERFYDTDSGSVLLDHINVRDLNLKWLRTQIGLVSQEPTLFATTISKNIEHGLINSVYENLEPEKKQELIVEAAKKANAHDFVSQLPNGYETMVGERGFLLSGGQKQRIAIARAIVKNPRILLLDEATSALDTTSEGIVQQALDQASVGRTTITIAHRLSTIKKADNIIVMGKGRILEQGTHDALLSNPNGPYSSLVNAQKIRANVSNADNAYEQEEELEAERLRAEEALKKEAEKLPELGGRVSRSRSITSVLMADKAALKELEGKEKMHGTLYLLRRLALINKEHIWTLYVPGFIASVCAGAVYPSFAILFGRSLQNFSKCSAIVAGPCAEPYRSDMRHHANLNALYFFIISLIATLAVCIQTHNLMLASSILMERLRRLMMKAYLRADVSFHDEDNHSSGALTASIADSAQKVNGLVGITLGTILQSISTLVVGFIIALAYGWKLALVVIACSPLTLSAGFVRLKLVVLKDVKIKKAHEDSAQRACEAAAAIRTVASLTREADCMMIYREALRAPAKVTHDAAIYSNILYALSQSFAFWVIALGFWYGSRLLINQELNSADFFTVLTAVVFGSIQAGNVFSFAPDISNAATAADGAIKVLDSRPEIDSESTEGMVLEHCEGNIKFEGVHFRYPTRPSVRVLRGITLDIKKGSYVGLVGASGSGKSTTIQLLQRFYDPAVGQVTIDGHDIKDLNLKEYRRHVALVSQEPSLYDGTIAFNLRLGAFEDADKVTDEMMRKAASDANILNFIESLPNGFQTEVGGRGTQLSGGQKQRIAIARAIIRDPKILLLDEATSALDSESEKVVQEALDKAARGRTTIAIAHRLSSISKSDRIFVLKDGLIQESGTHTNLMQLKGLYSELVQLQELQKD